jgi:hypothetical protein
VEPKVPQTVEQQMLAEAVATFDMFKKDEATLMTAIKARSEQVSALQQEQNQDIEHLLRVKGALSALQHLVTVYKDKIQKARAAQGE